MALACPSLETSEFPQSKGREIFGQYVKKKKKVSERTLKINNPGSVTCVKT